MVKTFVASNFARATRNGTEGIVIEKCRMTVAVFFLIKSSIKEKSITKKIKMNNNKSTFVS